MILSLYDRRCVTIFWHDMAPLISVIPHPEYWLIVASTLDTGPAISPLTPIVLRISQKTIDMLSLYRSSIVHWMCNRKKSLIFLCLLVMIDWLGDDRNGWLLTGMIPSLFLVMDKCEWVYLGRIAVRCNGVLIVRWEPGHGDEGWVWCQQQHRMSHCQHKSYTRALRCSQIN